MIRSALTCLIPACDAPAHAKGLCVKCYARARDHVRAGAATWDELVALGLARRSEASPPNPFTVAFQQARLNALSKQRDPKARQSR